MNQFFGEKHIQDLLQCLKRKTVFESIILCELETRSFGNLILCHRHHHKGHFSKNCRHRLFCHHLKCQNQDCLLCGLLLHLTKKCDFHYSNNKERTFILTTKKILEKPITVFVTRWAPSLVMELQDIIIVVKISIRRVFSDSFPSIDIWAVSYANSKGSIEGVFAHVIVNLACSSAIMT